LRKPIKKKKKKLEKAKQEDKVAKQRRLERIAAVLSIIFLPTLLASSIFGMNLPDLPEFSFWPLVGITLGLSVVLLAVFIGMTWDRQAETTSNTKLVLHKGYGTILSGQEKKKRLLKS